MIMTYRIRSVCDVNFSHPKDFAISPEWLTNAKGDFMLIYKPSLGLELTNSAHRKKKLLQTAKTIKMSMLVFNTLEKKNLNPQFTREKYATLFWNW